MFNKLANVLWMCLLLAQSSPFGDIFTDWQDDTLLQYVNSFHTKELQAQNGKMHIAVCDLD